MDAFYASVEQRDNFALKGKPVVVGGDPLKRGVVSTCSYEARKFGIRSAMSAAKAKLLCPQAIFLAPDFEKYSAVSKDVLNIIHDYSNCVEPLSLDEAYIDVTNDKKGIGSATLVAVEIRKRIKSELRLTASAGVSYNKFLAKTASDVNKPDGITVIEPKDAIEFLEKLPIGRFYGIGKVTESKLKKININCGKDLKALSLSSLMRIFGKSGAFYYNIVRGIDEREVDPVWIRKSIARENTFYADIVEWGDIERELKIVVEGVIEGIKKYSVEPYTITVKVKYFDFRQITRSVTVEKPILQEDVLLKHSLELLKKTEVGSIPVRLLGVSVSGFKNSCSESENSAKDVQLKLPF